jgi:hypothetical protein
VRTTERLAAGDSTVLDMVASAQGVVAEWAAREVVTRVTNSC